MRPTKGVHIVVRKSDFPLNTAVFLRSPDDNRVVWPTPSLEEDVVYIGTTDTDYTGDLDDVHPDDADLRYLLNVANKAIPEARLNETHIVGSWAGLRPLVAPPPGVSESNTSRKHEISVGPTGMITISGGKFTSNRLMAKQFVDAAEEALKRPPRKGRAAVVPLPGAEVAAIPSIREAARRAHVPAAVTESWIRRYGSNAKKILDRWTRAESSRRELGIRSLTVAEVEYNVEAVRSPVAGLILECGWVWTSVAATAAGKRPRPRRAIGGGACARGSSTLRIVQRPPRRRGAAR